MTNNGKEVSNEKEHGHRTKINGSLNLHMEESNENEKRSGEWWERKQQLKMAKQVVKMLGGHKYYWRQGKRKPCTKWERNE